MITEVIKNKTVVKTEYFDRDNIERLLKRCAQMKETEGETICACDYGDGLYSFVYKGIPKNPPVSCKGIIIEPRVNSLITFKCKGEDTWLKTYVYNEDRTLQYDGNEVMAFGKDQRSTDTTWYLKMSGESTEDMDFFGQTNENIFGAINIDANGQAIKDSLRVYQPREDKNAIN